MKEYVTLLLISFIFSSSSTAQNKTECFEIKYLDFFGLEIMNEFQWPVSELDELLLTDFSKDVKEDHRKTNFLIPYIILQLRDHHPACLKQTDTSLYRKLTQLYFKIRQQEFSKLSEQPISAQLEFIRQDYYEQVLNDSLLPFMIFSMDDGPFYGQQSKYIPGYKKSQYRKTEFGTIFITGYSGKTFITVENNQGKHLWTRILSGNSGALLTGISFSEKDIVKTSLGYKMLMFWGGEALYLYLKNDGELRYYFVSW